MKILQVNAVDIGGGAARIAWDLFDAGRQRGHDSWFAVGEKRGNHPDVLEIQHAKYRSRWARQLLSFAAKMDPLIGRVRGAGAFKKFLQRSLGEPRRWFEVNSGKEDFAFPGTWKLLDLPPDPPEIVHGHNLHPNYFDLRYLPRLTRQLPVLLTLHDAWLLSGHCAHSLSCDRWLHGCGECPDLNLYPAVKKDATAFNWQRKRAIFRASRLFIATPSNWLMEKVNQSILADAVIESRVIHNGIDRSIFKPDDKETARAALGMRPGTNILLFAANGIRSNSWKDYRMLRQVVSRVADRMPDREIEFIALGEGAEDDRIGRVRIRFVPFQSDPSVVAMYYQAADIFLQASLADTYPTTVLESMACGTPVVSTGVGGIPEQIVGLPETFGAYANRNADQPNGVLIAPGDVEAMTSMVVRLMNDPELLHLLSANSVKAAEKFDRRKQIDVYFDWYQEIKERSIWPG